MFATNLARKASINMTDGTVKVAGDVEPSATIPSQVNDEWRAIVVPQTVPAGTTLFSITIDGAPYKFAKNEALTYVSGKMMKFNIRVDKTEGSGKYRLTLVSESIAPWENDPQSHDATATEYVVINSTAGYLKDSIAASHKDFTMVKRMKLTGTINAYDFVFMRDSMPKLTALNLKNVRIKGLNVKTDFIGYMVGGIMYHDGEAKDDVLPPYCLGDKKTLTSVVLPDVLKRIERNAFTRSGLTGSLNIPEGVVEIGDNAFLDNDFTGVLALPSTLKKIDSGAFANAAFICPLNLPDGIEEIGDDCFNNCRNLYGNLILPSHLKKLGSNAFRGCTGLKGDLVIPKSLTRISWQAFESCGLGGRLQLHDGITSIGYRAFSNNGFIGELELPKSLTGLYGGNFEGNNFSGSFKIPKGLTSISDEAFSYCTFEGEMEIPDGIMCIHKRTFYNSKNLQKIILPSELELIEEAAFQGCKSLRVIECKSPVPPLVISTAFDGVPLEDLTVIVPKSALNDYKSSESWSRFKHIIAK
ncbi:leucine-rich repeat protein [Prevotella sp.]|uniref:leucine-rich repeat protein n=1 Tax=Prevotella sp. TaxID=59823 RepID=UPI0040283448